MSDEYIPTKELLRQQRKAQYAQHKAQRKAERAQAKAEKRAQKLKARQDRDQSLWDSLLPASKIESECKVISDCVSREKK